LCHASHSRHLLPPPDVICTPNGSKPRQTAHTPLRSCSTKRPRRSKTLQTAPNRPHAPRSCSTKRPRWPKNGLCTPNAPNLAKPPTRPSQLPRQASKMSKTTIFAAKTLQTSPNRPHAPRNCTAKRPRCPKRRSLHPKRSKPPRTAHTPLAVAPPSVQDVRTDII
jgi:hypothetical protein